MKKGMKFIFAWRKKIKLPGSSLASVNVSLNLLKRTATFIFKDESI